MYIGAPAISARAMARRVASASAAMGRVTGCHFGSPLPSATACLTRMSMTWPFSACMDTMPPFSLVRSRARKMVASSDMKTPG
ncbi:MAG: hypothetical protein NTX64_06725 [Elusimicrobia bacterium]|nr:hypothetical protein [Elusimicrobiota bacterium]